MRPIVLALAALLAGLATPAAAEVVTRLPTTDKVVALTFDACESITPAFLDTAITEYLAAEQIPYTIFVSGRFARHQREQLAALAKTGLVELENHSFNHPMHMEKLSPERQRAEVEDTSRLLAEITGKGTRFFRFPAGNYDAAALARVEALGQIVVHWEVPSGDPARSSDATHIVSWVLAHTHPGSIHIFHVNGRGWHTHEALPILVAELRKRGYRFVRLDQAL